MSNFHTDNYKHDTKLSTKKKSALAGPGWVKHTSAVIIIPDHGF